jgi:hypothetical protein
MRWLKFLGVLSTLLVAGCTSTPPLHVDGIAIGEVVERVKCEIAFAIPKPQPPYPTGRYQWLRNWTAKVDLTLITNSRSQVTPSASFINPISAGTFTFGLSAGLDTSAERTETLSFTLSMREMWEYRKRAQCNLPDGRGARGDLGLQEWIESALAPVDKGQLRVGRHPRPGAKSPSPPPVMPALDLFRKEDRLIELKVARDRVVHFAKAASVALETARDAGNKDLIQETYDAASVVYGAQIAVQPELKKAEAIAAKLLVSDPDLKTEIEAIRKEARDASTGIDSAKGAVDRIVDGLPRDPPIDGISHSVRFVVTVNGSLSPNWVLARFRGPTAGGSLLSGSHSRTHTLSIAFGTPQEQERALNNLVIIQNLRPAQ